MQKRTFFNTHLLLTFINFDRKTPSDSFRLIPILFCYTCIFTLIPKFCIFQCQRSIWLIIIFCEWCGYCMYFIPTFTPIYVVCIWHTSTNRNWFIDLYMYISGFFRKNEFCIWKKYVYEKKNLLYFHIYDLVVFGTKRKHSVYIYAIAYILAFLKHSLLRILINSFFVTVTSGQVMKKVNNNARSIYSPSLIIPNNFWNNIIDISYGCKLYNMLC